jgi:hypothetical protein
MLLVTLGWHTPPVSAAANEQRPITWQGLAALVGQKVRVVMPDGARIEGKATALEADALAVEIRKTSNPAVYPKGRFLAPRATLKTIDVNRPTKRWRIVCTTVGGVLGFYLGIEAAISQGGLLTNHPRYGTFAAIAIATPLIGYVLGNAADRHVITYVITP